MLVLKDYELNNTVTYKHAKLKLNRYPLVKLGGQNLDSRGDNLSNASGKSLLFNILGSVLFNHVRTSAKKNEKSSFFLDKSSSASVVIDKNGTEFKITQYFKGTSKWEIERDGKKLKFRETKNALDYIRNKILGVSEQQFFSQVLIDGRTKTPLQSGNSKQRFEYFEDVFKLNAYDALSVPINKDYNRIKGLMQELEIVTKEYKHKKSELPEGDIKELEAKQALAQGKFDKIRLKIDELLEQSHQVKMFIAIAENLDNNLPIVELKEKLAEELEEAKTIEALHVKSIKYNEQKEAYEAIEEKREALKAKIKAIPKHDITIDEIKTKLRSLNNRLEDTQTHIYEEEHKKQMRIALRKELKVLREGKETVFDKYADVSIVKIQKTIANNKAERKALKTSIESLQEFLTNHDHNDEHCPTCRRTLTKEAAKHIVDIATDKIKKCTRKISILNDLLVYNAKKAEVVKLKPYGDMEELKARVEKYQRLADSNEVKLKQINKRQELRQVLLNLPEIAFDKNNSSPPPYVYVDLKKDLYKRIENTKKTLNNRLRLKKLGLSDKYTSLKQAENQRAIIESQLDTFRPILDKMQNIISSVSNKISMFEMISKDIARIRASIKALKTDTQDFAIYEALRKAMGPKGLRKLKTVFFANQLMNNLNKYASYIYNEPIKFKINVSSTNIDILAERNGKIADVRSLSGAESSAFTLLLLLCMLPFIKANNRFNIIVLDELEIGMDIGYKQKFVEKFLPLLQQLIPNIYLITPQSDKEFYVPNAKRITVVKHNGISKLKFGE